MGEEKEKAACERRIESIPTFIIGWRVRVGAADDCLKANDDVGRRETEAMMDRRRSDGKWKGKMEKRKGSRIDVKNAPPTLRCGAR